MTPQQIKIRNLFHPRKVELIRMIAMFELDLLELELTEKNKILNCHRNIKIVRPKT